MEKKETSFFKKSFSFRSKKSESEKRKKNVKRKRSRTFRESVNLGALGIKNTELEEDSKATDQFQRLKTIINRKEEILKSTLDNEDATPTSKTKAYSRLQTKMKG